jgi:hypothetical protein
LAKDPKINFRYPNRKKIANGYKKDFDTPDSFIYLIFCGFNINQTKLIKIKISVTKNGTTGVSI